MKFILSPSAIRDLDQIAQYFMEVNVDAGEQLFKALNQQFVRLTQFPNIGKRYPHLHPEIRGLLMKKHLIFCRVNSERLEIVRVVDGRKDLAGIFSSESF